MGSRSARNELKRAEIEAGLRRQGFAARAAGPHLFYHPNHPEERYKMTTLGVKRERRLSTGEWMRVKSGYYKDLSVGPDGRIAGMTSRGMV